MRLCSREVLDIRKLPYKSVGRNLGFFVKFDQGI